jgi:hypothetical protein
MAVRKAICSFLLRFAPRLPFVICSSSEFFPEDNVQAQTQRACATKM